MTESVAVRRSVPKRCSAFSRSPDMRFPRASANSFSEGVRADAIACRKQLGQRFPIADAALLTEAARAMDAARNGYSQEYNRASRSSRSAFHTVKAEARMLHTDIPHAVYFLLTA